MKHAQQFYIGGCWVDPLGTQTLPVVNPATERESTSIALGNAADVDRAVAAAQSAFGTYSVTTREDRMALLERIVKILRLRASELASAVSEEMGAPISLAKVAQAPLGYRHLVAAREALKNFKFEEKIGATTIVYEPIGVCGLITPWNWPLNQIGAKVAPALAAGCTMVLKPSEIAPLSALIFADVLDEAGVPKGVFNLVNGDGATVGAALSAHHGVDLVSFTGSTRAGIEVAQNAAMTVKRVTQELGGKSANIILLDADLETVLSRDVRGMFINSGQSCNAASRILVQAGQMARAIEVARETAESLKVGPPGAGSTDMGPVASRAQFDKIQSLIKAGLDEGAMLVTGGLGRPEGMESGYYVKPTVFASVTKDMTIAREEIFGPVIVLIAYDDEDDAVLIANDSVYGLSGMVSSSDLTRAEAVARRMRTGMVHLNGAGLDVEAPFGGYRQSGNGREFGVHGLREFLEVKSIFGAYA